MDADHPYALSTSPSEPASTIIELPIQWALDDWEPYVYLPAISGSGVIARPAEVAERWISELDALHRAGGLFVLTCHPFVSGRASRTEALASVIEHARGLDGLWIATADEVASWTRSLALTPIAFVTPSVPIT